MDDWYEGYVTDIDYIRGYYEEINPVRMELFFLAAGLIPPKIINACELGFGQGVSLNIFAAGSDVNWFGTDFNPTQMSHAHDLAQASGAKVQLFEDSFEKFADRQDLPNFDFIALHGIWTWVSAKNQQEILRFIDQNLSPGGVVYISYNTLPGCAPMLPVREWMTRFVGTDLQLGQPLTMRIENTMAFLDKMLATQPGYFHANPSLAMWVKDNQGKAGDYLAHEYFNRHWMPVSFANMAESLSAAKLSFACSASNFEGIESLFVTPEQGNLLMQIHDPILREASMDFFKNQQFRRDYWVKGPQKRAPKQLTAHLDAIRVQLLRPKDEVDFTLNINGNTSSLQKHIYEPIIGALADQQPHFVGALRQKLDQKTFNNATLIQAKLIIHNKGDLIIVQSDTTIEKARGTSQALNGKIIAMAHHQNDLTHLVSPLTGGGVGIDRIHMLFIAARDANINTPAKMADYIWDIFEKEGTLYVKEGKPLEPAQENREALKNAAQEFQKIILPALERLHIST